MALARQLRIGIAYIGHARCGVAPVRLSRRPSPGTVRGSPRHPRAHHGRRLTVFKVSVTAYHTRYLSILNHDLSMVPLASAHSHIDIGRFTPTLRETPSMSCPCSRAPLGRRRAIDTQTHLGVPPILLVPSLFTLAWQESRTKRSSPLVRLDCYQSKRMCMT